MSHVEIGKAIVEYYNVKGFHAYEVQVSITNYNEVCKELGCANNGINYTLNGVLIIVMRGLGDDRINILGPAGQIAHPLLSQVGYAYPPPPNNNGLNPAIPSGLFSGAALQVHGVTSGIYKEAYLGDSSPCRRPCCECGSEKVGSPSHSTWCPKHS